MPDLHDKAYAFDEIDLGEDVVSDEVRDLLQPAEPPLEERDTKAPAPGEASPDVKDAAPRKKAAARKKARKPSKGAPPSRPDDDGAGGLYAELMRRDDPEPQSALYAQIPTIIYNKLNYLSLELGIPRKELLARMLQRQLDAIEAERGEEIPNHRLTLPPGPKPKR